MGTIATPEASSLALTTPTAVMASLLPVAPTPEVVNAILKWPSEVKLGLAKLLRDSVSEQFHSLEEAKTREREILQARVDEILQGEAVLIDASKALDEIEKAFREKFPQ